MSYGIEFDHDSNLIVFRASERVDLPQLIQAFKTTCTHPEFNPQYHTLCDFRGLKEVALQPQDLLPLVMEMKAADCRRGRTAIVVSDNREHRSFASVFEKLAADLLETPHQVFDSIVEAEVWLGTRNVIAPQF